MSSKVRVEPCRHGGWEKNVRITNGEVELVVTLEVGPRIIRYGFVGGPNVLAEVSEDLGRSGEPTWRMRGGHRLWLSPEDPKRTYVLDNGPVQHAPIDGGVRVTNPPDATFGLGKSIDVTMTDTGEVRLVHRIVNAGAQAAELAPWALTVLAPGGTAVIPLPPPGQHPGDAATSPADFAPSTTMALWPYFRFDDPRFSFGLRALRLRQDPAIVAPTKVGFAHRAGWVGYWNALGATDSDGVFFAKRFTYAEGARYPDGGMNFETFTDDTILELESLGPLVVLPSGGETAHIERWSLHRDLPEPISDDVVDQAFFPKFSLNFFA